MLEIIEGNLYEIWTRKSEGPKLALAVKVAAVGRPSSLIWEMMCDGEIRHVHTSRIFAIGTATAPPDYEFPKMTKVYPGLYATDIVSVQPMTLPSASKIFFTTS